MISYTLSSTKGEFIISLKGDKFTIHTSEKELDYKVDPSLTDVNSIFFDSLNNSNVTLNKEIPCYSVIAYRRGQIVSEYKTDLDWYNTPENMVREDAYFVVILSEKSKIRVVFINFY